MLEINENFFKIMSRHYSWMGLVLMFNFCNILEKLDQNLENGSKM